ncbi:DUF2314 domain-containing protein [Phenylobacterium soli]|uniref:DUF2314 domain-containing protein n=1 Tax=Phenylobacterium soli TaxID=2170551 RepID=A0A328AMR7_9CAUL|nr:DUF2314 domain-containing protein [Phenylobacterium soli]RAK55635.1 hypothetical protein DJ017_14520 [Phenylobacterium soli]
MMRAAVPGIVALMIVTAVATPACSRSDADIVQWTGPDDAEMLAAESQAKQTLPVFWRRVKSGDPQIDLALLKIGFPAPREGTEYLWLAVGPDSDADHRGEVLNEPEAAEGVRAGQIVTFDPARIGDWSYRKAGKYYGQYTTRVMIKRTDPQTAREEAADLSPMPLEPESN